MQDVFADFGIHLLVAVIDMDAHSGSLELAVKSAVHHDQRAALAVFADVLELKDLGQGESNRLILSQPPNDVDRCLQLRVPAISQGLSRKFSRA